MKISAKQTESYEQNFDRRHGAVPLTPLKPGGPTFVKTDEKRVWKKEGTVVAADPKHRTCLVNLAAAGWRGCRKHDQKFPSSAGKSPVVSEVADRQHLIHRTPSIQRTSSQRTSRIYRFQPLLHLLQLHATPVKSVRFVEDEEIRMH